MTYFPRKIQKELRQYSKSKEIVIVTGMRQVGKTTLYRMIYDGLKTSNKIFIDLENPVEQKIFEEVDYNNILANLKHRGIHTKSTAYLFLDEIQAMPEVVRAIKYLHDHYDIKFFLTGSSSFYLKNLFPESMAGRKYVFELFPLDFEEFLFFKGVARRSGKTFLQKSKQKNAISYENIKKFYDEYVQYGGFPAVVLKEDHREKTLLLQDILTSYFEKEVKALADFKHLHAFRELMLLLMQRVGSKLEIAKLASEIGVSRETVYSYLNFLEHTYFVHFITPYSKNVDREISGGRKVYLCDTGLLNQFARVSEGALFENSVYLNARKYGSVHFYQKRSGGEIDFVINKKIALEVKHKGSARDYERLMRVAKSIDMQYAYLITREFLNEPGAIPAVEL